jgi:hypothetical protein
VKYWQTVLAILAALSASVSLADDFKTINGKEYKNVKVSRVEPDGIVLKTKSGISKVYFTELPKKVQERFHYDAAKSNAYSAQQNAGLEALRKQQEQAMRQRQEVTAGSASKSAVIPDTITPMATPMPQSKTVASLSPYDIGNLMVVIGGVLLVGIVVVVVYTATKAGRVSPERIAQLQAEAKEFFDKAEAGQIQPPVTPLMLRAGEKAFLHEPSTLSESRSTRAFAGAGTRIEGIYIGGGGSKYFQSLTEVDSGTLTLTNQRLVFTGALESRVLDLKKDLVAINTFGDTAIEVSTKRAKRLVFAVRNPLIWGAMLRTLSSSGDSVTVNAESQPR